MECKLVPLAQSVRGDLAALPPHIRRRCEAWITRAATQPLATGRPIESGPLADYEARRAYVTESGWPPSVVGASRRRRREVAHDAGPRYRVVWRTVRIGDTLLTEVLAVGIGHPPRGQGHSSAYCKAEERLSTREQRPCLAVA